MCHFIVELMTSKSWSTLEGNKELFALKSLEDKLVTALKKKDSRALCERLVEKSVISIQVQDKFSSLDHVHLKEELKVRYLVQHIYDAVKDNKLVYYSFVDILTAIDEGVVSEFSKELHQHEILILEELEENSQIGTSKALVGSKRPRASVGEICLCESDVPLLTELLADGAHRAYQLGLSLNLKQVQIENCFKDQSDYKMILSRVIGEWIRTNSEVCTLNNLKTALASNLVNLSSLATILQEKFVDSVKKNVSKKPCVDIGFQHKYRSGDITVARGKSALLGFQVTSLHPVQYEWRKNGRLLSDSSIYSGTTKSFLFINCADNNVQGQYECIVTDGQQQHTEKMHLSLHPTDSEFNTYFSEVYVKKEVPENSWFPSSDKVINLVIINKRKTGKDKFAYTVQGDMDDILKGKEKVEYEEVFDQYKSGSLLLVEGRPGSGKTTLMLKVSKDWALDKGILQGAEIVVLVPIRLLDQANKCIDLADLFKNYIYSEIKKAQILEHYEKLSGEGVCFIIDGLDEYEYVKDDSTIILQLITKRVWPLAMIIVASRPIGTASLRKKGPKKTKRIEVLGFQNDQISEYVFSYFKGNDDKAKKLISYLESHVNVCRMCYLPVHAAMICFLYDKKEDIVPQTASKIYETFALFSVVRKCEPFQHTNSLNALTDNENKYFSNICKLAFDMIVQSKQVILQSEMNFPLTPFGSDKSSLGLVTIDSTAELFDMKDIYSFLHLTFQEYLAAFYLSQLDSESEVIKKTKGLKVNLRIVWKFYCGIVQFDKDSLILKSLMSDSKTDMLYKVQCAFESQQQIACDMLLELSEEPNSLCFSKNNFIPTDFLAMTYVIETSHNQVTKLLFQKCSLDSEGVDLFLDKVSTGKLDNIKYLGFNKKNCTVLNFKHFFKILFEIQHSIETLDLQSVDIYRPNIVRLLQDLEFSNLCSLKIHHISSISKIPISSKLHYIEYNSSEVQDYNEYFHHVGIVTKNYCNAVHYNVRFEMLSYCCNPISLMPKTNTELFKRCRKLILINCGITDEAFSELMNISNYFVNVDTFHLDFNKLTLKDCVLPSGTSEVFKNLSHFSAQCNSIKDSEAIALAKVLQLASSKLKILNLQGNPITEKCAETLSKDFADLHLHVSKDTDRAGQPTFEELCTIAFLSKEKEIIEAAFKCLCHVQDLNLTKLINLGNEKSLQYLKYCYKLKKIKIKNVLSQHGIFALAEGLKSCTNLQEFVIHFNNINSDSAVALVKGLKGCIYLNNLNLGFSTISSDGVAALAKGLKSHTNLQILDLGSNNIGSNGAAFITKGLKMCSNLQVLHLDSNNIGSGGAAALAEGLEHCNLQTLDLGSNNIGSDGAVDLAKSLKKCTNLQMLDLGSNNISSDGAVDLANSLKYCTNLQIINLGFNNIGSDGAIALAEGLKYCTNLQTLDLGYNEISSDGTIALADGLKYRTSLQTLDLGFNNVGSDGIAALAEGLKYCTNLQIINLGFNNIGSDGAIALAEGLKYCTNLQTLDLGYNEISSDGTIALAEGLKYRTSLQTLDLGFNNVGSDGIAALAKGLKYCTNLQIINLGFNHIGSDGAVALAEDLKYCTNLQTLDLGSNNVGSDGIAALAEGLKYCTNLQMLDLGSNNIGSDGVAALAKGLKSYTNLQILDLGSNNIGSNGAAFITNGLKMCSNLQVLHLDSNNIGSGGAAALAEGLEHCNLQTLDLGSNNIGSDGAVDLAKSLKKCTNLQMLDLGSNNISSDGAVDLANSLKYCTNLQIINLGFNNIGSDGAIALAEGLKYCTNLQTLDLGYNEISSDGTIALADGLKYRTSLQTLDLGSNNVGSDGIAALAEGLKYCTNLQIINLGFNNIGSDGAVALAEDLKYCTNLQTLDLGYNEISSDGTAALADGLKYCTNLQTLDLGSNNVGSDGIAALAEGLKYCTNLQIINLGFNNIGSDGAVALAEDLKYCTNLQTLDLGYNEISSDGTAALADGLKYCTNLQTLDLGSNNVGSDGIAALAEGLKYCTNLQIINLGFNNIGSDGAVALAEDLKYCTNLQKLDLGFNNLGSEGIEALANGLKYCINLQTLRFGSNGIGSDAAVVLAKGLKYCTNLQTLDLGYNEIGSDGTAALADGLKYCTNLQTLEFGSNNVGSDGIAALAEGLKYCTNLQTLNLGSNNIGSDGAALAEDLKHCTNLQKLDLGFNNIGSEGIEALANGLKYCINLQTLRFGSNDIGSDAAVVLAKGLKYCTNLQTLDLGYNEISSDGTTALADGLKYCTNLQTLDLGSNNVGSDGIAALAEGLKYCTNLQTLDLGYNKIGSDGTAALADGLKYCTNLLTLDLGSNNIGSDGIADLVESLKHCTNLQTLDLGYNKLGSYGTVVLAKCLKFCHNLQTVDLDSNNIDSYGAAALADGLKHCTNVQTLHLRSNNIGLGGEAALAKCLKSCTNLQTLNLNSNDISSDENAALKCVMIPLTKSKMVASSRNVSENQEIMKYGEKIGQCESSPLLLESGKAMTNRGNQDWISYKGKFNEPI